MKSILSLLLIINHPLMDFVSRLDLRLDSDNCNPSIECLIKIAGSPERDPGRNASGTLMTWGYWQASAENSPETNDTRILPSGSKGESGCRLLD